MKLKKKIPDLPIATLWSQKKSRTALGPHSEKNEKEALWALFTTMELEHSYGSKESNMKH